MTNENKQQQTAASYNDFPQKRPNTPLLDTINRPQNLKKLSNNELVSLANELRVYLLYSVAQSGGHLGANLGVVELTIALHYTFASPKDKIIWDVGHQAYAHKVLTGRREQLPSIRQQNGLTAFPERQESMHDCFGVGHSSTSISAGLGMSLALRRQQSQLNSKHKPANAICGMAKHDIANITSNENDIGNAEVDSPAQVVCIIGDGAMSAGMAFEAMNDAVQNDADLLVILNDNDMSISCATGGLSKHLSDLRSANKTSNLFIAMGFEYIGIVDGHNIAELTDALTHAKTLRGQVLLHIATVKGKGFIPAEIDPVTYHAVNAISKSNSKPKHPNNKTESTHNPVNAGATQPRLTYSQVFGQFLCDTAAQDERLVAITPAMISGSGMTEFAKRFADRCYDVAIAEQHAVTLAAGMATQGIKPIVAIYSTFLQRGYDQFIHDVALQNLDVTFAIDRAGLVGADGATHAGVFDYAFMRCIPNVIIACPANEDDCYQLLHTCYHYQGVSAVRYPRGMGTGAAINKTKIANSSASAKKNTRVSGKEDKTASATNKQDATRKTDLNTETDTEIGRAKIAAVYQTNAEHAEPTQHLAVLVFGTLLSQAKLAVDKIATDFTKNRQTLKQTDSLKITLVNMRWVKPLDTQLIDQLLEDGITHIATIEEHMIMAGAGSAVNEYLINRTVTQPITNSVNKPIHQPINQAITNLATQSINQNEISLNTQPKVGNKVLNKLSNEVVNGVHNNLVNNVVNLGIKDAFIAHASHEQQLAACGLDSEGIYQSLMALLAR